jgi:hypothetical protein
VADPEPTSDRLHERIREAAALERYQELMSDPRETVATMDLKPSLEHSAGYSSVGSFWKNRVTGSSDRENGLATLPGVDEPGNGRYVHDSLEEDNGG